MDIYGTVNINDKGEGTTFVESGNLNVAGGLGVAGSLIANDKKLNAIGDTTTIRSTDFSITDTTLDNNKEYPVFFNIKKDIVTIGPNTTINNKLITKSAEIKDSLTSNTKTTLNGDVFINNDIKFRDTINLIENSKFFSLFNDVDKKIINGFDEDKQTVFFRFNDNQTHENTLYFDKIIDIDGNITNKVISAEKDTNKNYYLSFKSDNSKLGREFVGGLVCNKATTVDINKDTFLYINNNKIVSPNEFANISFGSGFNIYPKNTSYSIKEKSTSTTETNKQTNVTSFDGEIFNAKYIEREDNDNKYQYKTKLSEILKDISNKFRILNIDTANILNFDGKIKATTFSATSDIRLKDNIKDYNSKKSILDIPIKSFTFKNDEEQKTQIGIMAQDLKEVEPLLVDEEKDGYYSIKESKLVYLLLEQLQKEHKKTEELTRRIENLERRMK